MRFPLIAALAALGMALGLSPALAAPLGAGWTCTGSCGTDGADGVVTLSPFNNPSYEWVSTNGGITGAGELAGIGGTNGSMLDSPTFAANAGDALNFYFNYVTSDGAGFADYAWAQLLDASNNSVVATLFTARTEASGTIAPGVGLPANTSTLTPSSVPIIGGAPIWSPLGTDSGTCYQSGCGYTGWINSNYVIPTAGTYLLSVGTTNWSDTSYQSGLALDGVTVAGQQVGVPEPASFALLAAGLAGLAFVRRRKAA